MTLSETERNQSHESDFTLQDYSPIWFCLYSQKTNKKNQLKIKVKILKELTQKLVLKVWLPLNFSANLSSL